MAYQKIGFKNGNVLTAEQLIHMEDGIINAEKKPTAGGTGTGLPSDVGPYKQMATDGDGQWQAVDRLAWKEGETIHPIPAEYIPRIVITNNEDTGAYDCNVSWEEMWGALKNGLPIVYVVTAGEDVARVSTFIDVYADAEFTFRIYGFNLAEGNLMLIKTLTYSEDGTITEASGPL